MKILETIFKFLMSSDGNRVCLGSLLLLFLLSFVNLFPLDQSHPLYFYLVASIMDWAEIALAVLVLVYFGALMLVKDIL